MNEGCKRTAEQSAEQEKRERAFQDFVCKVLWDNGLVFAQYTSSHYQIHKRESHTRIEVKHDHLCGNTGRLWFDCKKKWMTEQRNWKTDTGINSTDGRLMWVIGDYKKLFIVPHCYISALYKSFCNENWRKEHQNCGIELKENSQHSSVGLVVPIEFLRKSGGLMDEIDCQKYIDDIDEMAMQEGTQNYVTTKA